MPWLSTSSAAKARERGAAAPPNTPVAELSAPAPMISASRRDTLSASPLRRKDEVGGVGAASDHVSLGDPVRGLVPLRDPVPSATEQAIERAAGGGERRAALGGDDLLDQCIDGRIGDAGEIVRALGRRRLGGEKRTQSIPRRRRQGEAKYRHIEVKLVDAGAILHRIDDPQRRLDAESAEILDEWQVVGLDPRVLGEKLDGNALAVRADTLAILDDVTRLLQELVRLAQERAVLARTVGDRRHERLAEHLVRHLAAERLEQRELFRARLALGHHVRILEHRMDSLVGSIHDGLVGPFEVEGVDQGFAQLRMLELLPPRVDEPALHARRPLVGQNVALDAPVPDRREIVARRPDAGGELLAEDITLGGEALEGDVAVAVELVAHGIEVVLAARDRQIGAPPILDPLVFDETARLEASDLVGAAAERRFEGRFVKGLGRVIGAGE